MAATITFRPKPGIAEALAARADGPGDRSLLINRALAEYLGVSIDESTPGDTHSGTEQRQAVRRGKPPRGATAPASTVDSTTDAKPGRARKRARQAVPDPPGVNEPECPHPKDRRKQLQYGTQCLECGQMVR